MNTDARGSLTELLKTDNCGQVSVNISKPGITKGEHWHNSKWEFFIVVSGHGLIQERKIGADKVIEFEVSGENIQAVHIQRVPSVARLEKYGKRVRCEGLRNELHLASVPGNKAEELSGFMSFCRGYRAVHYRII